jgi:competence protein ComEA
VWETAKQTKRVNGQLSKTTTNNKEKKAMRKSHLIVLSVVLIAMISNSALAAVPQIPAATATGVVNINTADVIQLSLLPRVGAKVAQRIADYRKEHGNFRKTSDLMQVKGFGEKSFEKLSPYITVDGKTTLTEKVHTTSNRPRKSSKKSSSPTPAAP